MSAQKNDGKKTGGGSAMSGKCLLVERHEVFRRLYSVIALAVDGMEPIVGDDDYEPTTQRTVDEDAQTNPVYSNDDLEIEILNDGPIDMESIIDFRTDIFFGPTPPTDHGNSASTIVGGESTATPAALDNNSAPLHSSANCETVEVKPPTIVEAGPIATQSAALDSKANMVINPMAPQQFGRNPAALRRPIDKRLKHCPPSATKRFADDDKIEFKSKMCKAELQLIDAKIESEKERANLHRAMIVTENDKQRQQNEEHATKMKILLLELSMKRQERQRQRQQQQQQRQSENETDSDAAEQSGSGTDSSAGYDDVDHNAYPNSRNNSPSGTILVSCFPLMMNSDVEFSFDLQ